jgi:hypothetical protein
MELDELNWKICEDDLDDCVIALQECLRHLSVALEKVEEVRILMGGGDT